MKWEGLEEFREAMQHLPDDLRDDAEGIVQEAVDHAEAEIYAAYGRKTGNLRDHLKQERVASGPFGITIRLKNTAKHAWLWDNGTEARHYITESGAIHETGAMWGKTAPPHTFVRGSIKWRRWMYDQLKAMLVEHGLLTRGEFNAAA